MPPERPQRIRVALADDSYLMREAVHQVVEHQSDVEIVADCEDGTSLLAEVERVRPDVVVTDVRMPPSGDREGIRIAQLLRETNRPVTEICFDVGFSSLGTFSRTFRKVVGEPPSRPCFSGVVRVVKARRYADCQRVGGNARCANAHQRTPLALKQFSNRWTADKEASRLPIPTAAPTGAP